MQTKLNKYGVANTGYKLPPEIWANTTHWKTMILQVAGWLAGWLAGWQAMN